MKYKEVMRLDETRRQEVMKSEDLKVILRGHFAGTEEQINQYAKYHGASSKTFLITILSRANSNIILDQFPTSRSEVESWIENEKN